MPSELVSPAWTTGRIARLVGAKCEGPPDRALHTVASLDQAQADALTFCVGGRWAKMLEQTNAGAVLLNEGEVPSGVVALRHPQPRYAYAQAAAAMFPCPWPEPGIDSTAAIAPSAVVHPEATVEAYVVIAAGATIGARTWVQGHTYVGRDAIIGEDCRLMPHSVVMDRCVVGDRVWLQPSAIIGADGFGQVPGPEGVRRIPQLGIAVLEDDVEVGANSCVDRGALDETRLGEGSRLDNLVQIAHGVRTGKDCLLAAFAGVAGGSRLGSRVIMGGRSGIIDGIEVGDDVIFAGLASASRNVRDGERLGGAPARPYLSWLKELASLRRLPKLRRAHSKLEERVAELEAKLKKEEQC
ncbi:MAG: UDP-3-O-(3-hydroxymyristoyl)glucosamine N-acyltransferase [Proteobacteria bacterium]|jgi:UDP-3-O-[3-hydroxymyristoyl] glucosamine N-acyltransferase|nr:UDP-3-O-(3-hydroxymyristoyl)glucosamine N-acyltransferase [Pseudomonadota bacterium]